MKRFLKRRFAALRVIGIALLLTTYHVCIAETPDPNAPPVPDSVVEAEAVVLPAPETLPQDAGDSAVPVAEDAAVSDMTTEAGVDTPAEEPIPFTAPPAESASGPQAVVDDDPVEIVQERDASGTIRMERGMKKDAVGNYVRHGDWRLFDAKGTLIAEGQFKNNERCGQWRRFYKEGEVPLLSTPPYDEFKGPFLSQATFDRGKFHGTWIISDVKQQKISEIEFDQGRRHGKACWYHPGGKTAHEIQFREGLVHGDVRKWDAEGQLIAKESYEQGRRVGAKLEHYPRGEKKSQSGYLFAALLEKKADDWWFAKLAVYETVGEDEKHGHYVTWHANGNKECSGEYEHNLLVGKMTWWYANGQKSVEGQYEAGRPVGEWNWYHKNGQKSIAGGYSQGQPTGNWNWWKEDGKLTLKTDFSQAREIARLPPKTSATVTDGVAPPAIPNVIRR